MRIKRLDIFGFKSFVNKTSISFSDGISAIVGPNGCGKSNIVDAIRWVLGEQSPRQLRGNAMEDVIFSGSESRAPLGMAEVTLTLANGDGTAPPPFENTSEIAVTRRLYRSGESEYMINKAPCRLKDIIYLFMDTGVGVRSHSIIDQGQIGHFIEAKPAERRTLVEEVAGISKFKYKKEEALRKIEHTRQNLLRIEDVQNEIKRQMNSLHRQAKKAERYLKLKKKLKELDLFLASLDYAKWLDILSKKEEAMASEDENKKVLEAKTSQLELQAERLEMESLEQEKVLEQQREELHRLEALIRDKKNRIQYLNQGLVETKQQLTETAQEIERQKQQKEEIVTEKENSLAEVKSLNITLAEKKEQLAEAERHLQELRAEQRDIQGELENYKMEMVSLLAREANHRNQIRNVEQALGSLKQKRQKNHDNSVDILSAKERAVQERINQTGQAEKLKSEINDLQPLIVHLDTQERALTEKIQILQKQLQEVSRIQAQKTAKLELLQNLHTNLEGIPAGTKALLQSQKFKTHGLLAEYLETEPDLSLAVEAALGDKLQSLLVKNADQAFEALTHLKTYRNGRSGFVIITEEQTAAAESDRSLGRRVKARPPYANLVKKLLKDVYWFETLEEALNFWKSQSGKCTVVTRDGDLIDQTGFVQGGSHQGTSTGFFPRKEEIRQLTKKLDGLSSTMEETNGHLKQLSEDLRNLKTQKKQKEAELAQKQFENRLKRQELEQLAQTEEIHQKRLVLLEQERAELDQEEAALIKESSEVKEKLEKIQTEKTSLQAEIDLKENEVTVLEDKVETGHKLVTDAKMELTALNEKIHHLEAETSRLDQEYKRVDGLSERLQLKMDNLHVQREKITGELSESEDSLALIEQKQQEQEQWLRDQALEYQQKRDLMAQVQAELRAAQKELKEVQAGLHSLMVAKTEAQLNIQHLEEKIYQAYEIPLQEEYSAYRNLPFPPEEALAEAQKIREEVTKIGEVNLTAIQEYKALEERYNFVSTQHHDLVDSIKSLEQAVHKINRTSKDRLHAAITAINEKLSLVFPMLFGGGSAELRLIEPGDPLSSGIELYVQPPGKKLTNLNLLSGGEKALATISLLFAVYMVKPSPFCFLDEVDAHLDQSNSERFNRLLKEIGKEAQIILITHNQKVMETANILYGVTMEEKGISKLLSVRLN